MRTSFGPRLVLAVLSLASLLACSRGTPPPAAPATPATPAPMAGMPAAPTTLAEWAHGAQMFDGLGTFHRTITTKSAEAQAYFDQGMRFMWAFNHDEATRSFAHAAELDPKCAMCLWGVALTAGPNLNQPAMAAARAKLAHELVGRATTLAANGTAVEQALIGALAARYPTEAALDPSNAAPVLLAFANAMRDVATRFPDDSDVQVMCAEAIMNTNAWKLWTLEGEAAPGTAEIVTRLESVIARDPTHPGANHYYIHAIEASPHPENAVASAERLRGMMPGAGHLEHMPSHIFQRIGRYEEAAEANRKGAAADGAYLARTAPPDYYPMYVAHNFQFLAFATAMQGRRAATLEAVNSLKASIPEAVLTEMPGTDWYMAEYYMARVRFGQWDEIIAEPRPTAALKALTGGYLFATAAALAERRRIPEAEARIAELDQLRATLPADAPAGLNNAPDVLALASTIGKARIARAKGDRKAVIELLTQAVVQEDKLSYDEPADWFFPVRHLLGAELLAAGKAIDAEAVYRADLRRNPGNGWSLFGLAQALHAEHKEAEARAIEAKFKTAWQGADVTLLSSAM